MNCIKCGSESRLYKNLCGSCFVEDNTFCDLPGVINVTLCPTCSAWLRSRHWEPSASPDQSIESAVGDQLKVSSEIGFPNNNINIMMRDKHISDISLECNIHYDDLSITEKLESEVRLKFEQCDVCSKIAASYFTAIIQVRADERMLTDFEIDELMDRIGAEVERLEFQDRNVFISKVEKIHSGFDIYISKHGAAKQIIKVLLAKYGGTTTTSPSLVGQKDGKDVHRITFLIRLPKYQLSDILEIDGRNYLVRRITNRKLDVIDLSSWEKTSLSSKNLKRVKVIAKKEDFHEAQIVSKTEGEFQILDNKSYKTYDVMIPKNYPGLITDTPAALGDVKIFLFFADDVPILIPPV